MQGAGCSILDTGCWMLDAGCWMLDTGYWMLDAGCWILVDNSVHIKYIARTMPEW
jgi:hypothetical protein